MHLEKLPSELLSLIIQEIDSPRHLVNLIRASPVCYWIYANAPTLFLAAILRNAIHPAAMHHALAILHVPKPPPMPRRATHAQSVLLDDFLRLYFQGDMDSTFPFPVEKDELESLCRIYNRTEFLIRDYAARATRILSAGQQDEAPDLSWTELARFQRAFFRHDVYCLTFPIAGRIGNHDMFPGNTQYHWFLSCMEMWEVEELNCAHYYYMSVVDQAFQRVEDELVDAALRCPGAVGNPEAMAQGLSGTAAALVSGEEPGSLVHLDALILTPLAAFSREIRRGIGRQHSFYASLGSPVTYRLAIDDGVAHRDTFRHITADRDFLPEAIDQGLGHVLDSPLLFEIEIPDDLDGLGPYHPGPGYYLFRRFKWDRYLSIKWTRKNSPLRERAYVFWDNERIALPQVTRSLARAQTMDAEALQAYDWGGRPSAEDRLQGIRIPSVELKKLESEFGCSSTVTYLDIDSDDSLS